MCQADGSVLPGNSEFPMGINKAVRKRMEKGKAENVWENSVGSIGFAQTFL